MESLGFESREVPAPDRPRAPEERDRLLEDAALGAGLVDAAALAAARADRRAEPGRSLADALAARAELGPVEHDRLAALERHLAAPAADGRVRFVPLRLLGRGGLGEVWAAFDMALERLVALKLLRPDPADEPGRAARLRREARVTARVAHPAVVAVHAVGADALGRPGYAMRLVAGASLQAELRRLHDGEGDGAAGVGPAREALVDGVLAACGALAAAHARGVVHRDVRPANLLREPDGATFLIGWEHARTADAPDDPDPDAARPRGVPGLAAPELAAGAPGDARADVYGLGATLYAIWTGDVPDGPQALEGDAGRALPRELAAICRRALAPRPEDRYARAEDLAADLRAWREGRRPAAWAGAAPRPAGGRRRHTLAAALGLAAAAAVLVAGSARRDAAREREAARAEVRRVRAEATASARRALKATSDTVQRLGDLAGEADRKADPGRVGLRPRAAAIWRDLLAGLHDALAGHLGADDRLDLAAAILETADESNRAGAYAEGLRAAEQAEAILRPLAEAPAPAGGRDARPVLAGALRARAFGLGQLGRAEAALACNDAALALLDATIADQPDRAFPHGAKAEALAERAQLVLNTNVPADALAAVTEAIEHGSEAAHLAPDDPTYGARLAHYRMLRGDLYDRVGQHPAARAQYEQSLAGRLPLLARRPDDADLGRNVAAVLQRLAREDLRDRQPALARGRLDAAVRHLDAALAAAPGRVALAHHRVVLLLEVARIDLDQRRHADAEAGLAAAGKAIDALLARVPTHAEALASAGTIGTLRGDLALRREDLDAAIAHYTTAAEDLGRLRRLAPRHVAARLQLAYADERLAAVRLRRDRQETNDLGEAGPRAREAAELAAELLRERPEDVGMQTLAIQSLLVLAEAQARGPAPAEALPTLHQCDALLMTGATGLETPQRVTFHRRLAVDYCLASAPAPAASAPAAPLDPDRALHHLECAVGLGFRELSWLRAQPKLRALHRHPRFRALLADLAMPADPFVGRGR